MPALSGAILYILFTRTDNSNRERALTLIQLHPQYNEAHWQDSMMLSDGHLSWRREGLHAILTKLSLSKSACRLLSTVTDVQEQRQTHTVRWM